MRLRLEIYYCKIKCFEQPLVNLGPRFCVNYFSPGHMTSDAKSDDQDTYFLRPIRNSTSTASRLPAITRDHLAELVVLAITRMYSGPSF
jgi:hypothetical protein